MLASGSALSINPGEKMVLSVKDGLSIEVFQGDVTLENADALVNPTSRRMLHNTGVSAAISQVAGPQLAAESKKWVEKHGSLDSGETGHTSGGYLPVTHVIHTVGTHFTEECNQDEDMADAILQLIYNAVLDKAKDLQVESLVLPAIGTGMSRVPARVSAGAALKALADLAVSDSLGSVKRVRFVDMNALTVSAFADELQTRISQFPPEAVCFKDKSGRGPPVPHPSSSQTSNSSKLSHLSYKGGGSDSEESSSSGGVYDDPMEMEDLSNGDGHPSSSPSNNNNRVNGEKEDSEEDKSCSICMEDFAEATPEDPVQRLEKCGHRFHKNCIQNAFKHMQPKCPICQTWYGIPEGNQPRNGTMTHATQAHMSLPGFQDSKGAIVISYSFPNGVQGKEHPRPGVGYSGTSRVAYLPDNPEGRKVLALLHKAFHHRLVFTVGDSHTTGAQNCVVWNNIHHKTNPHGGAQGFGYPDPTYLSRVEEELAAAGITVDMIKS